MMTASLISTPQAPAAAAGMQHMLPRAQMQQQPQRTKQQQQLARRAAWQMQQQRQQLCLRLVWMMKPAWVVCLPFGPLSRPAYLPAC